MNKLMLPLCLIALLAGCEQNKQTNKTPSAKQAPTMQSTTQSITYPETKKGTVVDEYFAEKVADPYRWLENDMSDETKAWVKQQNKTTYQYLSQIPYRDKIKARLGKILDYEKVGMPFIEGKYRYFYKNDGLQNQYVLYRQKGNDAAEVFLDPNTFSDDGTVSMSSIEFSEDGSLAVYMISEGGSDWRKAKVIDTATKEILEPELTNIKFSGISWLAKQGFYYSSYDKPEGSRLSAKTDHHKLYYHKLATPQSEDKVVFGGNLQQKYRYVSGEVTKDGRYLIISASVSTSGNKVFLQDLSKENAPLITITDDLRYDTELVTSQDNDLFFITNMAAENKRLVKVDVNKPTAENWQDIIPESDNVLSVAVAGKYLMAKYMKDALSFVQQYDLQGNKIRDIQLPDIGTATGFYGKKSQQIVYYSFSNHITPSTIFSLDLDSGASSVYSRSKINFASENFITQQVFYTSKDGTKVPMTITHKKGITLDGSNPTILYGYGGFNISLQPKFSAITAVWLELGGVYAVPNLRGGGEYGKKWHKAGTKMQKQNVFDDFIAAAEYLIAKKYTSSEKLAIRGGSNGGLLVGATLTQRPELFKVALPAVGVLDMLRYHTFTSGAGWAYDYGKSDDSKEMFQYLLNYSPVHNVKAGTHYPATLITTGDHDDRVVPAHSFKFAAQLQAKQQGNNPVLIRIETDAGHGAGTPISKTIEQYADIFGFTLYNMGITQLK